MLCVVGVLSLTLSFDDWVWTSTALLPLAAVPCFTCLSTADMARLQLAGHWRYVSGARAVAAVVALVGGVPVAVLSRSVLGASVTLLVAETAFWLLVRRSVQTRRDVVTTVRGQEARSAFKSMQAYSLLAWIQGQADRVLIGGFAGTVALGLYSVAGSIGRSAGDSIAAAQASVLRVDLTNVGRDQSKIRSVVGRHVRSGMLLNAAAAAPVLGVSFIVLAPILGPSWAEALQIVPVIVIASIPSALSWCAAPVHIHLDRSRRALWAPIAGLMVAPLIALAAFSSLQLAAWAVLGREIVVALTQLLLMQKAAPWREAAIMGALIVVSSACCVALGV
ncbi:O-antigen/teichoic acid export membrane protein [Microbacterium sp. SORGH_AS 862]|nr:O-antigen/teichoic acid export membrane protein [Microbacterium sp. SORGH_AS_0862]